MNYLLNAHILVVGDLLLDQYLFGKIDRISPEAPVPICHIGQQDDRPGGAGHVAMNITALGGQCSLLGVMGKDDAGLTMQQQLNQHGVRCHIHASDQLETIVKLRVISQQQQLIRLDFEKKYQHCLQSRLMRTYQRLLKKVDAVIVSDYGKGTLTDSQAYIQAAVARQIPVFVDSVNNDYQAYQGASLISMNDDEFITMVGDCSTDEDAEDKGRQLIEALDLSAILVTQGGKGMRLFQANNDMLQIEAADNDIYDVTGASETVIAVAGLVKASGYDWATAMRCANAAAGVVATKLGAANVTLDELRHAMTRSDEACSMPQGVVTETELAFAIHMAHQRGEKVVMTNGCFDLLHAGHVAFLNMAKQQGDRLIVAINDDNSVQRLKGMSRPILPLAERMKLLARLRSVDWVIAFSDDTPERLLQVLKPCILVKGGDYAINDVVGADIVLNQGGQVKVLPHDFADINTTQVIERVIER